MIRVLFLELLNRSLAAGWLIAAILLFRVLLRRFPRWVFCLMWGIVGIRLVLPFLFESGLSLIPSIQTIEPSFDLGRMVVQTGIDKVDASVNTFLDMQFDMASVAPKVWYDNVMQACSGIWGIGVAALALHGINAEIKLHRKVSASLHCGENVYICDDITSPFVLGVLKPRIYLPSTIGHTQTCSVLLHERAHIARLDPLWKMLGFILLCVYWFNPLVWAAYSCFSRDIELACDERVIRSLDDTDKREYAQTLLQCSIRRRMFAVSPVGFGEVGVKRRIKSIVWFKKSSERTVAAALILCAVLAVGFLTNPTASLYRDNTFMNMNRMGPVFVSSHFDCDNWEIETGEYFFSQDASINGKCAFYEDYTYGFPHIHEHGTVMCVSTCKTCGRVLYAEPLYEGYQCISSHGGFVKTE